MDGHWTNNGHYGQYKEGRYNVYSDVKHFIFTRTQFQARHSNIKKTSTQQGIPKKARKAKYESLFLVLPNAFLLGSVACIYTESVCGEDILRINQPLDGYQLVIFLTGKIRHNIIYLIICILHRILQEGAVFVFSLRHT